MACHPRATRSPTYTPPAAARVWQDYRHTNVEERSEYLGLMAPVSPILTDEADIEKSVGQ